MPADYPPGPARTPIDPATYSRAEVAALLSVSERTVDSLVKRGAVPGAFKVGVRVKFLRAPVDAWLKAGCPGAGPLPPAV